jgi:hypothetical protein
MDDRPGGPSSISGGPSGETETRGPHANAGPRRADGRQPRSTQDEQSSVAGGRQAAAEIVENFPSRQQGQAIARQGRCATARTETATEDLPVAADPRGAAGRACASTLEGSRPPTSMSLTSAVRA